MGKTIKGIGGLRLNSRKVYRAQGPRTKFLSVFFDVQ